MNLEKLQSLGAFLGDEKFIPAEFDWTPDGAETPVKFKVKVKAEPSAADFEFVRFGGISNPESSSMARQVHRLVRFVSVNGEPTDDGGQLTDEQAQRLAPSLLLELATVVGKTVATEGKKKPGGKAKKA